jgi:hypothetical protein
MNRAMSRPVESQEITTTIPLGARTAADDPLTGLVEYGFVVLEDRRVSSARAVVDNVVVGPTGIFVIDRNSWPGQISASSDQIYVDGRQRTGATDGVVRASTAVEDALGHELKPIGTHVQSVISFDAATNRLFEAKLSKITLCGSRSLVKVIRAGEASLGPETVVRLALAADRLLD